MIRERKGEIKSPHRAGRTAPGRGLEAASRREWV
jgi:hypothetical protein